MKKFPLLAATLVLSGNLLADPAPRTWSDPSGSFSFEGTFVRLRGNDVVLEAADGSTRMVPLARLSETDQAWVQEEIAPAPVEDPLTGVAWYSAVEPAFAEAKRSGRPIFFMAAATQCSSIPGVF